MRIRAQVVLAMCAVAVIVSGVLIVIVAPRVRSAFDDVEQRIVSRDVELARNLLSSETSALESTAHDWAAWDETAEFVNGQHPTYVAENLGADTMINLRLTLIALYDVAGNLVYAEAFDLDAQTQEEPSAEAVAAVTAVVPLARSVDDVISTAGLVTVGDRLAIVAMHRFSATNANRRCTGRWFSRGR